MHMCQTMLSKFSNAVCAHRVRKVWKMARKQVRRAMQYLQNLYISAHTHFSIASTTTASICVFVFTTILLTFFVFVVDPTGHLCVTLSAQPFASFVGIPPIMAACPFCATHAAGKVSYPTFLVSSKACALFIFAIFIIFAIFAISFHVNIHANGVAAALHGRSILKFDGCKGGEDTMQLRLMMDAMRAQLSHVRIERMESHVSPKRPSRPHR